MRIDTAELRGKAAYKLLSGSVVPRPIALVTTLSKTGRVNAAPFSFFNAVSADPPIVAVSVGQRKDSTPKDTAANIQFRGEFVVHIVDENLAERMNLCAADFPPDMSEVEEVGLKTEPSSLIHVPRLADAPIALECQTRQLITLGKDLLILGNVVSFYVRDDIYDDGRIDPQRLKAIGRLAGATYTTTRDRFEMQRPSYSSGEGRPNPAT